MSFKKNRAFHFHLLAYVVVYLLLLPMVAGSEVATVHGAVYDWETFELLENTIIGVKLHTSTISGGQIWPIFFQSIAWKL